VTIATLALLLTIALTVISQTLQKQVADLFARSGADSALMFYSRHPRFWLAMISLGSAMLSWLLVLHGMDVSRAYSLLSVNYVLMMFISRMVFKEQIPVTRWWGVICLLGGVWLMLLS
jgi:undecaprenyl phosphate-alpha-L-ara4N flippase subunit ArnE